MSDSASMSSSVQDSLPFMLEEIGDDIKKEMGHSIGETMPICTYNGLNCDLEKYREALNLEICFQSLIRFRDFKNNYSPSMGNCFTYNYAADSRLMTHRAGEGFGLTILLQVSQKDYLCTSQTAGFRIVIHNSTEHPFPDSAGYLISPGTYTNIALTQVCDQ
ncbi:MAG: hypothetical protein GY696_27090 [Gammaproteobacteria bacterium]|nr:hypothetical protein [Gammaproteobacteria bacterium]